jgi:hypothetical protein
MLKYPTLSLKVGGGILIAGIAVFAVAHVFRLTPVSAWPAPDPELQQALADLKAATPERAAMLESTLARAHARLSSSGSFDARTQRWQQKWSIESRSAEMSGDIEVRHYVLAFDRPTLRAWPDILADIQSFCAEPGLTIDHLDLEVAPEAERFSQAQVAFSVRLRP